MKHVIIIGAGMGGLAAALRLHHHGFRVSVLEKQACPGGRSNVIFEDGYRVDTGPTILLMKEAVADTYRAIGEDLSERLNLVRLDPNYRIYFHDDTFVDLFAETSRLAEELEKIQPGATRSLERFIEEGQWKYELGMEFVKRNYDRITDLVSPGALLGLLRTRAYQNLYKQIVRFFGPSDKLAKLFSFHSMFLGLSPFDALAMYSLITYADLAFGVWYPMGGIYSIVEDMVALASEIGVVIRTSTPVKEIVIDNGTVRGVRLPTGELLEADLVVSNADLPYTYRELIDSRHRKVFSDRRVDSLNYACSGYILYLGVKKVYRHVRHQALYFSSDYRSNLKAIFETKEIPQYPSFHLSIPTITDPELAPEGHTLLYVLAPMPNLTANIDWEEAGSLVRHKLLAQLERIVDPEIRQHIVWERTYCPVDWKNDVNAVHGTAFGSLSHGFFQSSYFRPHNKARDIEGLYFVGQGTYPGIGIPMVHISAKLVTERILQEWTSK